MLGFTLGFAGPADSGRSAFSLYQGIMTDVRDNPALHRFELDTEAGPAIVTYRREGGVLKLIHTEVPKAMEGHGIGSKLAKGVLEMIRGKGERIVPLCDFMRAYIDRHPDYADLVAK
jgi:predicted GNAT family acetyltransferase